MKNKIKFAAGVSLALLVAQLLLVLCSWILYIAVPSVNVRTLLGSEGVRRFFGSFTAVMQTPLLIWLILGAMAFGVLRESGLYTALKDTVRKQLPYRKRHALWLTFVTLAVIIVILSLMSFVPHAMLLGPTGSLFPGPFGKGIVTITVFSIMLLSVVYGVSSGAYTCFTDIYAGICRGAEYIIPFLPVYFLAVQLYESVTFVFF